MDKVAGLTTYFPRQKMSIFKKDKKWRRLHADWADNNTKLHNTKIRKSYRNKVINYDLVAGILHMSDIKQMLNPHSKRGVNISPQLQHYPIINNVINLLQGEESNRKTQLTVKVKNENAISTIEERKLEESKRLLLQFMQSKNASKVEETQEASRLQEYLNYNFQDLEELNDNYTLQHYMRELDFNTKLREGFFDVNVANEEIYYFDIVADEPIMEKLHPKKVFAFRTSNSSRLEDADIVIINDYWSPGKILDRYYDVLKEKDQKYIEDFVRDEGTSLDENDPSGYVDFSDVAGDIESTLVEAKTLEGMDAFLYSGDGRFGDYKDSDNNIRVLRVLWKSKKKLLKVKSYDPETGDAIENWRSETYRINKDLGEESTTHWVNEWWEATKIGKDIYVNMRPKPYQIRRINNVSICSSGLVGQIYNNTESKSYCILDRMKEYQYLYDIIHDRYLKLISNHIGKVLEVDSAKIPAGWKADKWLHYLRTENIAFVDSFKENAKGQMIGGLNNGSGKPLDLDLGNSIKLYVETLEYLNSKMHEIAGITPQRLGNIQASETVGGVERSVERSSSVTAELFAIHDDVKKRCAETLLEVAKIALKGQNKKIQFVTDDNINRIIEINGDDFASRDHGIFIENELELGGLRQRIEQLAHAWSQNETVTPSTILKIISDPSLGSIQRRIENDIKSKQQRDQQTAAQQQEAEKQMAERAAKIEQLRMELEQAKLAQDKYKVDADNATKLQIATYNNRGTEDSSGDLEQEKLEINADKNEKDIEFKKQQLEETIRHNKKMEQININKNAATQRNSK